MKIVTYNIQFATGKDGICDTSRIAKEVNGADIIAFQEVDRFWQRSHNTDQVAALMTAFPEYYAEYGAGINLFNDNKDDNGHVIHSRQQFGNLILSRFPIAYSRHHLLPKRGSIGPISLQRSALECIVLTDIGPIRLINTHLTHLSSDTRLPQIEKLIDIHRKGPFEGEPVCGDVEDTYWKLDEELPIAPNHSIIMGDFNCTPGTPEYTCMTGPVCDYGGRIINPELFIDAYVASGHEENEGHTSDVNAKLVRLDYIFLSTPLAQYIERCWIDYSATGSDHQPVWLELDTENVERK